MKWVLAGAAGKLDATAAGPQRTVELIESLIDQQNR